MTYDSIPYLMNNEDDTGIFEVTYSKLLCSYTEFPVILSPFLLYTFG